MQSLGTLLPPSTIPFAISVTTSTVWLSLRSFGDSFARVGVGSPLFFGSSLAGNAQSAFGSISGVALSLDHSSVQGLHQPPFCLL